MAEELVETSAENGLLSREDLVRFAELNRETRMMLFAQERILRKNGAAPADMPSLQLVPAGVGPSGDTWYQVDGMPAAPGGHRTSCSIYCRPSRLSRFVGVTDSAPVFQVAVSPVLFLPRDADRTVEDQQAAIYAAIADYLEQLAIAFHVAATAHANVNG